GIRTAALGTLTWPVIQSNVDEVILVSDDDVRAAMRFLALRMKLVVEPTGAVGVAVALSGALRRYGSRAGVIISGGNVAPDTLAAILAVE
ncbi:MAG: pyridoxal-phosphate dependent enzyme, partial [Ktedonobacterales bacterium]